MSATSSLPDEIERERGDLGRKNNIDGVCVCVCLCVCVKERGREKEMKRKERQIDRKKGRGVERMMERRGEERERNHF